MKFLDTHHNHGQAFSDGQLITLKSGELRRMRKDRGHCKICGCDLFKFCAPVESPCHYNPGKICEHVLCWKANGMPGPLDFLGPVV